MIVRTFVVRLFRAAVLVSATSFGPVASAQPLLINFESIPAMGNSPGAAIPAASQLADQFLASHRHTNRCRGVPCANGVSASFRRATAAGSPSQPHRPSKHVSAALTPSTLHSIPQPPQWSTLDVVST